MPDMKILFVNNTKNLKNIGCHMTSGGLEILLRGHEIDNFSAESIFKINQRLLSSKAFRFLSTPINKYSRKYFFLVKEYIAEKKPNLIRSIDECDLVLINGEGSIHHNKITGIVLVVIASIAKDRGKIVHLVNSTVQLLSPVQIRELKRIDRIVVRELYSKHFLLGNGINSVLAADAAWIFLHDKFPTFKLHGPNKSDRIRTLLTLGVLPNYNEAKSKLAELGLDRFEVDYLMVDKADIKHRESLGFVVISKTIEAVSLILEPGLLQNYSHVVTGRHHIAILCYYLGIPVSTLQANTYKIESTIFSLKNSTNIQNVTMNSNEIDMAIGLARNNLSVA